MRQGTHDLNECTQGGRCPAGWRRDPVILLGARERVGAASFNLGRGSHIRAVDLPGGGRALMVANEVHDVRLYTDLFAAAPTIKPLLLLGRPGPDDLYPLGYSGHPTPAYRYAAARPGQSRGSWDLVVGALTGVARMQLYRRVVERNDAMIFHWPQPLLSLHGVPEFVDLQRDGRHALIIGQADGTLRVVPGSGMDPGPGQASSAAAVYLGPSSRAPAGSTTDGHLATGIPSRFEYPGPVMPCCVDWAGGGRRDLLLGTGDGHVLLLCDIGDDHEVRYDRGRRLVADDGLVRVTGPACPTILETGRSRHLLVLDGEGELWRWPIESRTSYVADDLDAIIRPHSSGTGGWHVREIDGHPMLCAGKALPRRGPEPVEFEPAAPELELTPPVPGLCEVHVTLHKPADHAPRPVLRARWTDTPFAEVMVAGEFLQAPDQVIHALTADGTGRKLGLSQMTGEFGCSGGIPVFVRGIRFVPLYAAHEPAAAALPAVLAGISDTADWFRQFRLDTPEDVDQFVALQAACGFERLYYKLGGATWEYPSAVPGAEGAVPDLPGYPRPLSEAGRERCRRLIEIAERVNRVRLAAEACHRQGLAIFGQLRVQNQGEHAMHGFPIDRFFRDHPEWIEKDVWGHVRWNHSLAWPEVVDFHVRIVEEAMRFGLDGILVDTVRTLPKVLYSDPVVDEFRRRHDLDMRLLSPFDTRVVELQCEVMRRFMQAVRDGVRRVNPRGEVHLRVCRPHPLMGVDPVALARAGLVDEVLIEDRSDTPRDPDIRGLVAALAGTGCRSGAVFCRMNQWGEAVMPLDPYLVERKAREYVAAGACSVTVYESNEVPFYPELRRAFLRLKRPDTPMRRAW